MNVIMLLKHKDSLKYIYEDNTLRQGLEKMRAHSYTAIPVITRDGKYVGTVSEGDFLWHIIDKKTSGDIEEQEEFRIRDILRHDFNPAVKISVGMDELLARAMNQNFIPVRISSDILSINKIHKTRWMLKIASAVLVMAETEFLIYRNLHINFRLMYYNQSTVRKMYNILLVEDDKNIREMLVEYFSKRDKEKFNITLAENGLKGLDKAYENSYDLLLLDVMLPEMDGFTLCKEIRRYSDVPIMFITARTSEADMLNGYALGCDDYIVKPIALPVFYEKVKALIKRSKGLVRHNLLTVGNVSLNPNNGVVVSDGEEVTLTAKEYAILKILLENKNSVVSREKIITAVWHYDTMIDERVLDTHIKNIRKALGENASVLKTVIRRGYKAEDKK